MAGGSQSPTRSAAALAWIDAQPALPAPADRLDPSAVQRGNTLFSAAGCAGCHTGAQGTDNATTDVGTGERLQVPRLVELSYRAPFFHDGRVPTLEARFIALGGELHGHTSQLTAAEIADLVAYLESR